MYRELSEIPVYTAAYYLKSNAIRVTTSVRDHVRNVKRCLHKHVIWTASDVIATCSEESSDALASMPSPSGTKLAVLREIADGKRFVEVWCGDRLEASKDVTAVHDDFHLDPCFVSLSFSKSESSFVYTAEAKPPENSFRYAPDFGERLDGKTRPQLYLFRWTEHAPATVSPLKPSLPDTVALGQAVFAPDDSVFATGYEQTPDGRNLGLAGCWNRPSAIFKLDLPNPLPDDSDPISVPAHRLTPPEISARSPRVTDAAPGSPYTAVWLANPVGGPHASATSLHAWRSERSVSSVLVDYVWEPSRTGAFPGLYVDQLPSRPFLTLNSESPSHLVTHSIWGSRQTALRISLSSGDVHDLTPGEGLAWTVAGTDARNSVLVTRSAVHSPNELLAADLHSLHPTPSWRVIDKPHLTVSARQSLHTLQTYIRPIPIRFPTEVITIQPSGTKCLPLVTIPHGGPHGTFTSEFNPAHAALALEGYTVSLVNYTGSLGFGQKHVQASMGRAGELDVADCHAAATHLVALGVARAGPGAQFVQGGSHGGFLAAHLIAHHPAFFSAAVLRNPVVAAGELASANDIPDWAFAEFGAAFAPRATLTPAVFARLQGASPVARVDAVDAPVLVLAGARDRRVPPLQARSYYHALRARGKTVELLVFPGAGHRLDGVEAARVGWEAGRDWFARFA